MSYSKTNWTPTTPINPSNLNKMEEGIRQNAADIENLNSNLAIKLVASNISDNGKITYKPEANTVYLYVNLHFSAKDVYIIKVLNSIQFNATRLHGNSEGTSPYETFSFSNGELSIQSYGGHRGYLYKINGVKCG